MNAGWRCIPFEKLGLLIHIVPITRILWVFIKQIILHFIIRSFTKRTIYPSSSYLNPVNISNYLELDAQIWTKWRIRKSQYEWFASQGRSNSNCRWTMSSWLSVQHLVIFTNDFSSHHFIWSWTVFGVRVHTRPHTIQTRDWILSCADQD